MTRNVQHRFLIFIIGLLVVPTITYLVILFARGYRPNFGNKEINSTGLLVAQSYPDGANIYLNGQLKSATNTTLNLPPQKYTVEIKKDGYIPWKKELLVEAEIVTRATGWLFPSVPSLKAITSAGSTLPTTSPDGSKIAYFVLNKKTPLSKTEYDLYTLDLTESPLGLINRDPKKLRTLASTPTHLLWSPDSRSILISATASATLVETSSLQVTDVSATLPTLIKTWKTSLAEKERQKFITLPKKLQEILATSSAQNVWSPKENKLLYVATSSASIPTGLINPLPGSSTQAQSRQLEPGKIYIYDLEEDRNFLIGETKLATPPSPTPKKGSITPSIFKDWSQEVGYYTPGGIGWFPSSSHVYKVEANKIYIIEYDGQNPTVVYAGPMQDNIAIPYPSAKQMLILTNLNPDLSPLPNLYAISLR